MYDNRYQLFRNKLLCSTSKRLYITLTRFFHLISISTASKETWKTQFLVYIFQYFIVEDRQNLEKRGSSLSQN